MTDAAKEEITLSRVFGAPPELVYRAFVDPDQLCLWFGPEGLSVPCESVQIDARPGGFQRFVLVDNADPAMRSRVNATFAAYFEYVAEHSGTFKLVFESDFTNEPAVRARLDAANKECADLISQVIREDAGLADDEAYLLSIGLLGMAQVSARYWLSTLGSIPRETAEQLVARLAWRGISGWPRTSDQGEAH